MKRAWIIIVVGILVTSAPACSPARASYERWGSIVLYQKAGACKERTTDTIHVFAGDKVVWEVTNGCDQPKLVEIRFRADSPLNEQNLSVTVPADDTVVKYIRATVQSRARPNQYHYDVMTNGQPGQDPKLEVDP